MKKIFLACLATIATVALFSQNTQENIVKCHTYEMQDRLFESDPALKEAAEILGAQILKRAKELERTGFQKDVVPYIISVVFHIIHHSGPDNISFAQIDDSIRLITAAFNANSNAI